MGSALYSQHVETCNTILANDSHAHTLKASCQQAEEHKYIIILGGSLKRLSNPWLLKTGGGNSAHTDVVTNLAKLYQASALVPVSG